MQKQPVNATGGHEDRELRANREQQVITAIGKHIRACREQKGIAQETFAARAGIDRSYYGAVERGRYSVTAINLVKIALALEVEVGTLFPTREQLSILLSQDEL